MIAFPAVAALIALACAAFVGWDAVRRPRPERVAWTIAFLVFAVAALAEVLGSVVGWNETLARVYYLAGAVLVVGILALGELYLLFPGRMPAVVPGVALLVAAVAATIVWSAPIDRSTLATEGWNAIARGPLLIALAATINAGGTLILAGGALYSAVKLRSSPASSQRALGCLLIAAGTLVVALGGTLTRFGRHEYLYIAMALGVTVIFAGVLLTRRPVPAPIAHSNAASALAPAEPGSRRARLISLPAKERTAYAHADEGVQYVVHALLPLDDEALAAVCRRWSARPFDGDAFSRAQAHQVWDLRRALPGAAKERFDRLPLASQAQLAELYTEVWSSTLAHPPSERRA